MKSDKLPIFKAVVGEGQLEFVSLVDKPAIIEKGLAFKKEELKFEIQKDKQVIVGPAMIPDFPILRVDEEIGEYVIVFTKESISYFQEQFSSRVKDYKVNFDHLSAEENGIVKDAFIKSEWIIEDETYDKSRMYGFEFPIGTWMMEVKVNNTDFWNKMVKEEGRFGFSVEGLFQLEMTGDFIEKNKVIKMEQKLSLEQIMAKLAELSPEEVSRIKDAIEGVVEAPEEVVEQIVSEVAEEVNDMMNEGIAEGEEEEVVEEELKKEEKMEDMLTEEKVMEMIKPMFDEIYALIAEMKDKPMVEEEELGYKDKEEKMSKVDTILLGFRHLEMSNITLN
jgi:hypothetical protein